METRRFSRGALLETKSDLCKAQFTQPVCNYRGVMRRIAFEVFAEIRLAHNGLLSQKSGKKASANPGAP